MNIEHYLEQNIEWEEKMKNLKTLYDNWLDTGCVLYNTMSDIVSLCGDTGSSVYEKIEKIKDVALTSIDIANEIGLTNPDFFACEVRSENLARRMKLAKRRGETNRVDNRGNRKGLGKNGQCEVKTSLV